MPERTTNHQLDQSDLLWLKRNLIEINHNMRGDMTYDAILHIRGSQTQRVFKPLDVVTGYATARDAVQAICDNNHILSPWDIRLVKRLIRRCYPDESKAAQAKITHGKTIHIEADDSTDPAD